MKIARVVYEWPPPWIGLVPAPYELTKAQNELGNQITVFCGRWPRSGSLRRIKGVKMFSLLREPLRGTMLFTTAPLMTVCFLFWRLFNKVDIYHIHGHFGLYIYIYKMLFGFFDKTPVVSHFHNTVKGRKEELKKAGKRPSFASKFLEWPLAELSDRLAVRLSKACIFVSQSNQEEAVRYYKVSESKTYVVESGVNTELFRPTSESEKAEAKKALGYQISDVLLLNDGFFVERKNTHLIIEAIENLPENYKLMLVGKAEHAYRQKLDSLISTNNLSERVKFYGEKEYEEIPGFLKAADLYVLPSAYEGFPKTVLQSLSAGVPVIASGFDVPQISGLHKLSDKTAENLASQVKAVWEAKTPVDTRQICEKYSWAARAKSIQSIYNTLNEKQ